jgi:hypothetical protein
LVNFGCPGLDVENKGKVEQVINLFCCYFAPLMPIGKVRDMEYVHRRSMEIREIKRWRKLPFE